MTPMTVRVLTAVDAPALRARIAGLAGPAATERITAAADAIAFAIEPDRATPNAIALLRAHGAVAEPSADGGTIVVATRAALDAARRAAGAGETPLVDALVMVHARSTVLPERLVMRERTLDLGAEARVMGIVNVTPDSFYDRAAGLDDVVSRTRAIVAAGGAIVDVGGQSYAHWNPRIAAAEECDRVVPAVEAIRAADLDVTISIDTFKAGVADAALAAGAHLINDCSGLGDAALPEVVARHGAGLVVMHLKGELNVRDPAGYHYADVMREIVEFLYERTERAVAEGVSREAIAIDPGLEFGKEPATDLEILERFGDLRALGYPILFASSRKSFIGRIFGRPAKELLVPSLATAAIGIAAGARMLRVHDVAETVQLARMFAAVSPAGRAGLDIAGHMPGTPGNSPSPAAV
jgi:dihydropteroate synthase